MAEQVVLEAVSRQGTGKGRARAMRAKGLLPGVIYGLGSEPLSLAIDRHDLVRVMVAHGAHPLLTVKLDGAEYLALVKEVQIDAVRQRAVHVDFQRVDAHTEVTTEVAVHLVGEPRGVKEGGGTLETLLRVVQVSALPHAIPEEIEFDVSGMDIADVARVADMRVPAGVTILTDPDETVATVSAPRAEVPEAAPEEAAAEGEQAERVEESSGES